MSEYKIQRWDIVMSGSSNVQAPMIYVKPDTAFLQFVRENNFAVVCNINGTGTMYDGKQIPGTVSESANVPSCRPNFFKKTGWYVIKLWSDWYGYPEHDKLGSTTFSGFKGGVNKGGGNTETGGEEETDESTGSLGRHVLERDIVPEVVSGADSVPTPTDTKMGIGWWILIGFLVMLVMGVFAVIFYVVRSKTGSYVDSKTASSVTDPSDKN